MDSLEGKVVVVTGGASGIGLAIAQAAAGHGAKCVIADIEPAALETAAATLPEGSMAVETDVSELSSVERLRDAVLQEHGRVDVVCNNAGVGTYNLIADQTLEDWQWVLGVNLWGVIHGVRTFLPILRAQGTPGHIVNTASVAGLLSGVAYIGPYAASKVGVVSVSETLRQELALSGEPIGVSVVCPGATNTNVMEAFRNRPSQFGDEQRSADGEAMRVAIRDGFTGPSGLEPSIVAARVIDAVLGDRFWVITHGDMAPAFQSRFDEIIASCEP